ncbi:MAG: DUF1800 domain-containing protein [bacterium]|nr:DUF1800 domain-containing protein [bacterium]
MASPSNIPVAPKLAFASTGLEPHLPSAEQPWDDVRAGHLLRRTLIGPTPAEIAESVNSTPEAVVDRLLEVPFGLPDPPGTWVNEDTPPKLNSDLRKIERARMNEIRTWWMNLIVNQGFSIQERMVLFWHDHFATQAKDVKRSHLMLIQNNLLRKHAVGNFKTLVQEITRDPAMLYYLDGNTSKVGKPNENYARELMELFTTGVDQYTEQDIGEASRALTGWIVQGKNAVFRESRFDKADKTFMGRTGNFNDLDIIEIIFEKEVTAAHISRKIYQYFVYEHIDETVVKEMARILQENNYDLKPMLKTLFLSAHFFDAATVGARIKNPIEMVVGTARTLGMTAGEGKAIRGEYLYETAKVLGQWLLDPPNVAGWPGYRHWISTTTLPQRHKMTDEIVDGNPRRFGKRFYDIQKIDPVAFVKSFPEPYDARKLVKTMGECLTSFAVDKEREELLLAVLLEGTEEINWNPDAIGADRRIRSLIKVIFELPEFQLT